MELLKARVLREGEVLSGNIIKADVFLNYPVDVELLDQLAGEFRRIFDGKPVTKIARRGIRHPARGNHSEAVRRADALRKKAKSDNSEEGLYKSEIFSCTYNKKRR